MSDYVAVASPYEVQVVEAFVRPGESVSKGDVLARVESPRVSELIATLTARQAETTARLAQFAIQLEVSEALIQTADERLVDTAAQLERVNRARDGTGFVSDAFLGDVQKDYYAAMTESVSRTAERRAASRQLTQLEQNRQEARAALEKVRAAYNEGLIKAPADGIVGPTVAAAGEVINPGDHLLKLYIGAKYALVYLETGTLYRVEVGDHVEVTGGFAQSEGRITQVLPLTVPLPSEFQRAFRPPTRGQVARIELDRAEVFPIASQISVVGDKLVPGNDDLTLTAVSDLLAIPLVAVRDTLATGARHAASYARAALPGDGGQSDPVATGSIER